MASWSIPPVLVVVVALVASLAAFLKAPIVRRLEVVGYYRPPESIQNVHGLGLERVPDTIFCEDMHYQESSGLIFGVAEKDPNSRKKFFPPVANFNDPESLNQGQIFTIDPETNVKTKLKLEGFSGTFVTHGFDIYSSPAYPETVYIFAVNHVPNPSYSSLAHPSPNIPAAASQIELFKYTIGSDSAAYLRSIVHPLVRTPNDILAINEREFYVTNDHHHRSGRLRMLEDLGHEWTAWSNIVHVKLTSLTASNPRADLDVNIALDHIHNPNGFGHGAHEREILLGRAAAGVMEILREHDNRTLERVDSITYPMSVDNPSYFRDPYAKETGRDASGYVNTCLVRVIDLPHADKHPSAVWFTGEKDRRQGLIFQDDGEEMNTASTAVIIAIDPKKNGGKKEGWLFVTGFFSQGVMRTRIEL